MKKTENLMGTKPIFSLLMTMAIPPMISMLIQSMYNIIDSIYVAQLGEKALSAVSLIFPLQNLTNAVAVGFGVGVNACVAMSLGAKDDEKVNSTATHGIVLSIIHSIIFIIIGILLTKPFLNMFTNDKEVLKLGQQYGSIVICFSFGFLIYLIIEKLFQSVGNMSIPMILTILGAVINIILDPIFIFGKFGVPAMGIKGAAIATVIGQMASFIVGVILFRKRNIGIKIDFINFKFNKDIILKLYGIGIPSSLMMAMPSLLISILNGILVQVSQVSVAVLGIYYKLQNFVYMPANGVVQGMRPIISYNYGANNKKRVNDTLKISLTVVMSIMALGTVLLLFIPKEILHLFNATEDMMSIGVKALRIISLGFIISSINIVYSGAFEALGNGKESLIISSLRQLIILVPSSVILLKLINVNGVWVSFPISEAICAIISILLIKKHLKSSIFK